MTGSSGKYRNGADLEINDRVVEFVEGDKLESQTYLDPGEKVSDYVIMNPTEHYIDRVNYWDFQLKGEHEIDF